ncbi:MAG: bifunctional 23S rRNA (guanine(2069)-N(7))-methyltransferase RlmK/23S rRNA (guanine(2445)-N(2))-methyltransferase RlmL [Tatlockia sp.]|nr:bifunctional 23S rRNA (guanine(2069)-N(7))-methyltransferase RlmK/23S rRNA (guanine(2445)-N(2))-methyltransferase RlmL [Tatlockia sp.]
MNYSLFLSCPKGLEYLLEEEMKSLGLTVTRVSPHGVYGLADLALIYRLCLWTRIANRIQLILFSGEALDEKALYQLATQFPWPTVFSADKSLAIEFHGSSEQIRNTMYGAQVIKDGIVDHFRQLNDERPCVARENPDIRLHAYLKNLELTVSLDLTGFSLHQRGYRSKAGEAPIKENVAAAMLVRAKWPQLATEGYAFEDPFCGAGTLVIEAAMMAAHMAPGLLRQDQAFVHWVDHQPDLWEKIRAEALGEVKPLQLKLRGRDNDPRLIAIARDNAEHAGVSSLVEFETLSVKDCQPNHDKGLLVANPPYGERLGDYSQLIPLYQQLGATLHAHYQGWDAAILTSNPMLAKAIGLRASKQYTLYNGALECKLYCISLAQDNHLKNSESSSLSAGAAMLSNRLKKNLNHLQKWAKREQVSCFRVYDADLPEYAYAIDLYNDYAVLQEYAAPAIITAHKVERRSLDVIQVVPEALGISANNLVIKQRKQQKGANQYQKMNQTSQTMTVLEGRAKLKVNLYDYLDTGLFLDHRPMRMRFAQLAPGTRFLNCFCYTASASVHAALAGAITTNVDLSKTYLAWAEDNFRLNHLDLSRHQFIFFDCLEWFNLTQDRFDVIFLDPPSFSNSKRMKQTLDLQRDQEMLIDAAIPLLNDGGILYFSTNFRQFKLSAAISQKYKVSDISAETIDLDFKRSKRIHQCYKIMKSEKI